jgi:tRNA threonylcarbamoyladenosine dehydratase
MAEVFLLALASAFGALLASLVAHFYFSSSTRTSTLPPAARDAKTPRTSSSSSSSSTAVEEQRVHVGANEDEIMNEQLTRNIQFLGQEAFDRFRNSFIVVLGLGGIGSHAAHLLARSGVRRMRLVDFDQVTLSSLNRHAVATRADVGKPKATVLKEHLLRIVPSLDCEAMIEIVRDTTLEHVLAGKPSLVIDCIDNVTTKVDLLHHCVTNGIQVISSAGAGCRADPTRLRIADISKVLNDALIRATRCELVKKYKIRNGVHVLFSTELPTQKLMPLTDEQVADPLAYQSLPDIAMRIRIIPVLGMCELCLGADWLHVCCD